MNDRSLIALADKGSMLKVGATPVKRNDGVIMLRVI